MINIKKSVGIVDEDEGNSRDDVLKVQRVLNYNLHLMPEVKKLSIDGSLGSDPKSSKTVAAIKTFQSKIVKMAKPDGRVEPNGRTLRLLVVNARKPRPPNVSLFLTKVKSDAKLIHQKYKIPASILIAQAALESGWGQRVKGNAYFGIKKHSSTGSSTTFTTTEVVDGKEVKIKDAFRSYEDFSEAAEDYGKFLTTQPRYKPAFAHSGDPLKFADTLQAAGYATDPLYAQKLKSIIKAYYLEEYDK